VILKSGIELTQKLFRYSSDVSGRKSKIVIVSLDNAALLRIKMMFLNCPCLRSHSDPENDFLPIM